MPNTTTAKIFTPATGVIEYLPENSPLPVGKAGEQSILKHWSRQSAKGLYDLFRTGYELRYEAQDGRLVILDNRTVVSAEDFEPRAIPSELRFCQRFVWRIQQRDNVFSRHTFRITDKGEIYTKSTTDKKHGYMLGGLESLCFGDDSPLPQGFLARLFKGGDTENKPYLWGMQAENRQEVEQCISNLNTRENTSFGTPVYEILETYLSIKCSLEGYL